MDNEPIRVLQVIRHMNVGGAETFIMNLYRNIDRSKVQFDFLVFGNGVFDEEISKLGGKIYYLKYITDIGQIKFTKQLMDFFNNNTYNIIHSHIDQVSGIILEVAKKCKIQLRIAHSHSTKNSNGIIGSLYKCYLQSKITKNANILLACGKDAAKWLYKGKANKALIINNGIEIEKFIYSQEKRLKIRNELKINDNTFVIGHIGRFSKVKNHKFLIEIFEEYLKYNCNSILLLVGTGELQDEIKKLVNEKKIDDKVNFLGLRDDVDYLYDAMDCLVFPSLYEGMSITMIEAQVSGLNILASNNIDKSIDISNNIHWCDLKNNAEIWSNEIVKIGKNRKFKNIDYSKYSILETVKKMEEIYTKMDY